MVDALVEKELLPMLELLTRNRKPNEKIVIYGHRDTAGTPGQMTMVLVL